MKLNQPLKKILHCLLTAAFLTIVWGCSNNNSSNQLSTQHYPVPLPLGENNTCPLSSATASFHNNNNPMALPIDIFNMGTYESTDENTFCGNDTSCQARCSGNTTTQGCSDNGYELTNIVERDGKILEQEYVPNLAGLGLTFLYGNAIAITVSNQNSVNSPAFINPNAYSEPNNDYHLCDKLVNTYNINLAEMSNTLTDTHYFPLCTTQPYTSAYCKDGSIPTCAGNNVPPNCRDNSLAVCVDTMARAICNNQYVYQTPNDVFSRSLNPDSRPIDEGDTVLVSPADSRLSVFDNFSTSTLWVKGNNYDLSTLLGKGQSNYAFIGQAWWRGSWSQIMTEQQGFGNQDKNIDRIISSEFGTNSCKAGQNCDAYAQVAIARLAPQDYHRFHAPTEAVVSNIWVVSMPLGETTGGKGDNVAPYFNQSVNPVAVNLSGIQSPFVQNFRVIFEMNAKEESIGKFWMVVVAAMGTNSVQFPNVKINSKLKKGEEMGYFEFGGSTIILIFRPNTIIFDGDLIDNSMGNGVVRIPKNGNPSLQDTVIDGKTYSGYTVSKMTALSAQRTDQTPGPVIETKVSMGQHIAYSSGCPSNLVESTNNSLVSSNITYKGCYDFKNDNFNCGGYQNWCTDNTQCSNGVCTNCGVTQNQTDTCNDMINTVANQIGNLSPFTISNINTTYPEAIQYCLNNATCSSSDNACQACTNLVTNFENTYTSNNNCTLLLPCATLPYSGILGLAAQIANNQYNSQSGPGMNSYCNGNNPGTLTPCVE